MAESDVVLRFVSSTDSSADMRTFRVLQVLENAAAELELYKFSHPLTGHSMGTTTFHRKNLDTLIFETAGHVEWFSSFNATVWFGVDEFLKPAVLATLLKMWLTRSRRFKTSGTEYKWKLRENGSDMFRRITADISVVQCIDSKDKHVAVWSGEDRKLMVAPRCVTILDRIVVTCFLSLWFKRLGKW
ncbi:hypothetical protein J3R83DRAFT_569 [Lanmaoa asiatica]|nr:hypothetical protein J3R83DRAFT_569 [Lanmaoa asiatica]